MAGSRPNKSGVATITLNKDFERWLKDHRTPIASGLASIIGTLVATPLDFAKNRMQSYNTRLGPTVMDAYRSEGLRSFYRGVGAPLMTVTLVRTCSFSIYQKAKYFVDATYVQSFGVSPLAQANALNQNPTMYTATCFGISGAVSGFMCTICAAPFELIKINAQLMGKMARDTFPNTDRPAPNQYLERGTFKTGIGLARKHGLGALYTGAWLHAIRDTIGTGTYFATYESAKQLLANGLGNAPTHKGAVALAGASCGIVSWAAIYPLDTIKTRYQKASLTAMTFQSAEALRAEPVQRPPLNWFSLATYRGLGVSCARSAILNACFFLCFESLKGAINDIGDGSIPARNLDED